MSETTPNGPGDSPGQSSKPGAVKDRNCPYCGQAFTSSSLGRHLDLYIKEKNPKPPDGIHDVDAIRKMRGTITRRQPRGSLAGRRDPSAPTTPSAHSTAAGAAPSAHRSPGPSTDSDRAFRDGTSGLVSAADHSSRRYPFNTSWEATGVINDIPTGGNGELRSGWEDDASSSARAAVQRAPSRASQKAQLDSRQKLADAVDTARAAELALRELVSSLRAAKYVWLPSAFLGFPRP
jgi:hypothetical protein